MNRRPILTHAGSREVLTPYCMALGAACIDYEVTETIVGFHLEVAHSDLSRADLIIWHVADILISTDSKYLQLC